MKMMKRIALLLALSLLLAGCINAKPEDNEIVVPADTVATEATATTEATEATETTAAAEPTEAAKILAPLPDTTMAELTDAILAVSLEEGGAYVDDEGKLQMDLKIYSYDKYDMMEVAALKVGDIIFGHSGKVTVTSIEQNEDGTILINGGLDEGGFDLVTDEIGLYYERGFGNAKNWYEAGKATIRVSADFEGVDSADQEKGEVILYPGSFLVGEVTNYDFTPYNTTVRVEGGQVVALTRCHIP